MEKLTKFVTLNRKKRIMKKLLFYFFIITIILSLPLITSAQSGIDPGCDPLDPNPPPGCPIDGGVTILIATGMGLAARRIVKKNSEKE